jgi:hypothetical protein
LKFAGTVKNQVNTLSIPSFQGWYHNVEKNNKPNCD